MKNEYDIEIDWTQNETGEQFDFMMDHENDFATEPFLINNILDESEAVVQKDLGDLEYMNISTNNNNNNNNQNNVYPKQQQQQGMMKHQYQQHNHQISNLQQQGNAPTQFKNQIKNLFKIHKNNQQQQQQHGNALHMMYQPVQQQQLSQQYQQQQQQPSTDMQHFQQQQQHEQRRKQMGQPGPNGLDMMQHQHNHQQEQDIPSNIDMTPMMNHQHPVMEQLPAVQINPTLKPSIHELYNKAEQLLSIKNEEVYEDDMFDESPSSHNPNNKQRKKRKKYKNEEERKAALRERSRQNRVAEKNRRKMQDRHIEILQEENAQLKQFIRTIFKPQLRNRFGSIATAFQDNMINVAEGQRMKELQDSVVGFIQPHAEKAQHFFGHRKQQQQQAPMTHGAFKQQQQQHLEFDMENFQQHQP